MNKRGGSRKKVRPDDARGGRRTTTRQDAKRAGKPRSAWKSVLSDEARAALSVMGLEDAVRVEMRQDEAEIALVERLILEERDRRLIASED